MPYCTLELIILVIIPSLLLAFPLVQVNAFSSFFIHHFNRNRPSHIQQAFFHKHNQKESSLNMYSAATSKIARSSVGKLTPATTSFFLCDIQERFRPLMFNSDTIISTSKYLTSVATSLSIPIIATQQYTKVFGPTVTDCFENGQEGIDLLLQNSYSNDGDDSGDDTTQKLKIFEKKKFSMMTEEVTNYYTNSKGMLGRENVVLFGIEAHICVQQTCLDLIEMGKNVHLVLDCVSSQQGYDREVALKKMENAGAYLTTAQSLAFMLMESADHPNFKEVSKLTVAHMKLPNQFNDSYK
mmetsp:Transcript_3111/g.4151  ORF Transcript_3111/g.4151 Transcript_3111/m.4151 type:complete len:297 (+) Transcript_3111:57-947(+)